MKSNYKILFLISCIGTLCILLFKLPSPNKYYVNSHENARSFSKPYESEREDDEDEVQEQYHLSADSHSAMENEFDKRRQRVEYVCSNIDSEVNSTFNKAVMDIIVDTKHSLSWCPIYKAASSTWMKNFAYLSGYSNNTKLRTVNKKVVDFKSIVKQKYNDVQNVDEKLRKIGMTTKFMIVRHPFERLLSAYIDKLQRMKGREYYYNRYGKHIVQTYRDKNSLVTKLEPTFMEFLKYIATEKQFDEHWMPFSQSCQPCSIDYDYILKFDSFVSEYNFFITENNLQNNFKILKVDRKTMPGITDDSVSKKYYSEVSALLLLQIFDIYKLDFLLFSYSPAKYYYMTNDSNQKQ